jgi:hypothetical protein
MFLREKLLRNTNSGGKGIMKKHLVILGIITILFTVGLSGCSSISQNKILGPWSYTDSDSGDITVFRFYDNGSLQNTRQFDTDYQYSVWLTYTLAENKLIINENIYEFTVSDDNQKLVITNDEGDSTIFTKGLQYPDETPSDQTPSIHTPNIAATTDSTTNKVTIALADENVKWRDIDITTDPAATWQVFNANGNILAQTGNTAEITTDVICGDYIQISGVTGNVRGTMRYVPTNALLGTWTVNV